MMTRERQPTTSSWDTLSTDGARSPFERSKHPRHCLLDVPHHARSVQPKHAIACAREHRITARIRARSLDVIPAIDLDHGLAEIAGYMGPRVAGGPPGSITIRRGLEHIRLGALIFESIASEHRKKKR